MHVYFLFYMLYLPYKYFFYRKFKGQLPYDSLYFSLDYSMEMKFTGVLKGNAIEL